MKYIIFLIHLIHASHNYTYEELVNDQNLYDVLCEFNNCMDNINIKNLIIKYNIELHNIPYMIKGNSSFNQNIIYEKDSYNEIISTINLQIGSIKNTDLKDIYINEHKEFYFNTGIMKNIIYCKYNFYLNTSYIYINIKACEKITNTLKKLITFIPIDNTNHSIIINNAFIYKYFELSKNEILNKIIIKYYNGDLRCLINDHNCLYDVNKMNDIYKKFCEEIKNKILNNIIDID